MWDSAQFLGVLVWVAVIVFYVPVLASLSIRLCARILRGWNYD